MDDHTRTTTVRRVNARDGAAAIADALAEAQPGEVVEVGTGRVALDRVLHIPAGVVLRGAGRDATILVHDGDGPAIEARNAPDVILSDLAVESMATATPFRVLPEHDPIEPDAVAEDPPPSEWGLVFLDHSHRARVERVALRGRQKNEWLRGLCLRGGDGTFVSDCLVERFGRDGISLIGAREGRVENCEARSCRHGIVLFGLTEQDDYRPARAEIRANRCHGNAGAGILLFSAVGEPVEGNECWDNGMSGIALGLDQKNTELPARAEIRANRCHGNAEAGIVLSSAVGEPVEGNECWDNGMSGIALQFYQKNTELPARAAIRANRCRGNASDGILLLSAVGEPVEGNECWDNGASGIALQLDRDNTELPARAEIRANRCHGNAEAGIVLSSAVGEPVEGNECWDNGTTGIALGLDQKNTELPARAAIRANRCRGNASDGILLLSAVGEPVEGNECWDNGASGIALQLDRDNTELPARAEIRANRCHGNAQTGILLFSAVGEPVEGNECWDNGMSGIALQFYQKNTELPARAEIRANRCHGNAEAGIVLLSAVGEPVEGNECWDNGASGIALQLDRDNTELPARAEIRANRCHGNAQTGILLLSAVGEPVEGNECWDNGGMGIALGLDQKNTELPARAEIRANRCHGNAEAGILLSSAVGEPVEGNECWDNGGTGIALQLDQKNTELPARAEIRANRCHGNAQTGILLFSAVGEPVESNECWDNGMSGIALGLDPRNTELPARAEIRANRCHGNDRGYACVITAEIKVAANAAFGNRNPSVAFGTDGRTLRHLGWPLVDPGETAEQTCADLRTRLFAGAQAAMLEAHGLRDPDQLAQFLANGGLHDLRQWCGMQDWRRPGRGVAVAIEGDVNGTASEGLYALRMEAAVPSIHRFAARGGGGVARAVWKAVAGHALDKRPTAVLIGATGEQRAAIDALLADLRRINGHEVGDPDAGPTPSGRADLAGAVGGYSGVRIARPVVRDYFARSEAALAETPPVSAFLEPSRPGVWQRWRARVLLLAHSPEMGVALLLVAATFAVAVAVGWAKGFADPLGDPLGAAWAAVTANLRALELRDWLTLFPTLATLLSAGGIVALVNHALPGHLALRPRAMPWHAPAPVSDTSTRGAAWRRWSRRRLWGRGQIAVVVLRDLVEWGDDDRDALHEIAALRRPTQSLVVVVESPTRGILDRTLLRALAPASEGVPAARFDAVMASLGPEPAPLDAAVSEGTPPIGPLLGLPLDDGTARERALATIRDEAVRLADLIPTLSIASTHHHPATLRVPMGETGAAVNADVTTQVRRLARLHAGAPNGEIDPLSPDGLDRWIEAARAARAVLRAERHEGRRSFYDVLGRAITRGDVVAALRTAFDRPGEEALYSDYVQGALAYGEAAALADATAALRADEMDAAIRPNAALTALRGARQIAGERARMAPGDPDRSRGRAAIIATARTDTLAALTAARSARPEHRITLARLHVLGGTLRAAWSIEETGARSNDTAEDIAPGSPQAAFEAEVAQALTAFDEIDRGMARDQALASLRLILSDMDADAMAALRRRIDQVHGRSRDLAALIDDAPSSEALAEIARRHAAIAPDLRATLLATAARAAASEAQRLELANLLARGDGPLGAASARGGRDEESLEARPDIGRPRGVTTWDWGAVPPVLSWDDLLAVLGDINLILRDPCLPIGQIPLAELMIGTTDPIRGTARAPDRIEIEAFMPWSSTMAALERTDEGR